MHAASRILLLALALTGWAAADLPKKMPITKYTDLWRNSPFTSKPPPPEAATPDKTFEDLALLGVSPISGGYRVTLINKKKPDERITVDSSSPKSGFKILDVKRKSGDPLGTMVRMSSGTLTGTVAFDEKLLILATPQPTRAPPRPSPASKPNPDNQASPDKSPYANLAHASSRHRLRRRRLKPKLNPLLPPPPTSARTAEGSAES